MNMASSGGSLPGRELRVPQSNVTGKIRKIRASSVRLDLGFITSRDRPNQSGFYTKGKGV